MNASGSGGPAAAVWPTPRVQTPTPSRYRCDAIPSWPASSRSPAVVIRIRPPPSTALGPHSAASLPDRIRSRRVVCRQGQKALRGRSLAAFDGHPLRRPCRPCASRAIFAKVPMSDSFPSSTATTTFSSGSAARRAPTGEIAFLEGTEDGQLDLPRARIGASWVASSRSSRRLRLARLHRLRDRRRARRALAGSPLHRRSPRLHHRDDLADACASSAPRGGAVTLCRSGADLRAAVARGSLAVILHVEGRRSDRSGPADAGRAPRRRPALARTGLEPAEHLRPRRSLPSFRPRPTPDPASPTPASGWSKPATG